MRATPDRNATTEVFSLQDIAHAIGAPSRETHARLRAAGVSLSDRYVPLPEAVRLICILTGRAVPTDADRTPVTLVEPRRSRTGGSMVASGLLHAALVLVSTAAATMGLLSASDTEGVVTRPPATLVYTVALGPGGGGGGGGLASPIPPSRAEREAPIREISSPVPEPVRIPPPPRRPPPRPQPPTPPVRFEPTAAPPPPVPRPPASSLDVVVAPVTQVPGDSRSIAGLLDAAPARTVASAGPGSGGGIGSGTGTGIGSGDGAGIGPGSGGGTGGGPYRPGSGVAPPTLTREVRPEYTTEARRQSIEGDVDLEIVVRADGSVTDVRVVRGLGAGLDQKAVEAVRQWRFSPARRQGTPVDVVVQVSVEFKLR